MTTLISSAIRTSATSGNGFASQMVIWVKRIKQRTELARLSPEMLKDIGVSEAKRDLEIRKPFWKA